MGRNAHGKKALDLGLCGVWQVGWRGPSSLSKWKVSNPLIYELSPFISNQKLVPSSSSNKLLRVGWSSPCCFLQTDNKNGLMICIYEENNSSASDFKWRTSGWQDPAASSSGAAPSCWAGCGGLAAGRQRPSVWPGPTRTTCGLLSGGHHGQDSLLHPPGNCTGTQRERDFR